MAKIFIAIGILFLIIGLIYLFFPNAFNWFGRMLGDVNYRSEGGGFSFHFPYCHHDYREYHSHYYS